MNVEEVSVNSLNLHEQNPRSGDVGAICESIVAHGFVSVLVANERDRVVLVGNHRLMAARELGIERVPVLWVDLEPDAALRLSLSDNRASDLASYSDQALAGNMY